MTSNIDEHYIEALRRYYIASDDNRTKIVDFTSNVPSPFLQQSIQVEYGECNFAIIDGFGGARPYVFDRRFLLEGKGYTQFICGFILDSQVIHYMHQFVTDVNGQFRETPRGYATAKLLRVIAEFSARGWDFNPFFYIMEATTKAAFGTALPWTQRYNSSILKLQTMDDEVFLRSGDIVPDVHKIEEYVERHGALPFEATAASIVTNIHRVAAKAGAIQLQATYACLLKIGLIQQKKTSQEKKWEELFSFFNNDLGVFLAREAIVACLHFRGQSLKFIPIERRANDVKRKLLASTWDLFLTRLPEALIADEGIDHTSIYYVCTAEKALQVLGDIFVVGRVSSIEDGNGTLPTRIGVREDILNARLGTDLAKAFMRAYGQSMTGSLNRTPKSEAEIMDVVSQLEKQVAELVERF